VPVLILSGELDVATPAADGERVARHLPDARHVVFPHQGHGFANPACAARLIAELVASARVDTLPVGCVTETRPPSFEGRR
jgi:pimeloyl-ACP methyl ester carboxylesterase